MNVLLPELPPTVRRLSYGFLVHPLQWLALSHHMHISGTLVTQRGMAPAARYRAAVSESEGAFRSLD